MRIDYLIILLQGYRLPSHFSDIYGALQRAMYHYGIVSNKRPRVKLVRKQY